MNEKIFKDKINNWLKDRDNLILLAIIAFVVIFRLYWFFHTLNQPLWWDEADYMNMARTWLGQTYWRDFYIVSDVLRPVLFPLIISGAMILGMGEISMRLFVLICSIVSVPLLYGIGKKLFDKKIALIASFVLAVFWSFSFFSHRILVDVPLAAFSLASIYLFLKAYTENKNWKWYLAAGIFLGLAFLMKFSSLILVVFFAVYLLINEKSAVFKNKKIILMYLTSLVVVIPYFLWQWIFFGSPIAFLIRVGATSPHFRSYWASLFNQIIFSFQVMNIAVIVLSVLGILLSLFYVYISIKKFNQKNTVQNSYLFLYLWLIFSYLFFAYVGYGTYMEERYYFAFYPAIFLFAATGLMFIYDILKKHYKMMGIVLILAIIAYAGYIDIVHTNSIINAKIDSFSQLREIGNYIKANTNQNDTFLIVEEQAEVSYYAQRKFILITKNSTSELLEHIKTSNPKYLVFSFFYSLDEKANIDLLNYMISNQGIFKPVKAYGPYVDQEQKLPIAIVFQIDNSSLYQTT